MSSSSPNNVSVDKVNAVLTEPTLYRADMDGYMEPHEDGQWMRVDDHIAALERITAALRAAATAA